MTSVSEAGEGGAWASIEPLPSVRSSWLEQGDPSWLGAPGQPCDSPLPHTHTHRHTQRPPVPFLLSLSLPPSPLALPEPLSE